MIPHCVIIGSGGHACVLIDCLQSAGKVVLAGLLDADPLQWGKYLFGVPVLGNDDLLPTLNSQGITHFAVGLGGVGDNRPRQRLFELALSYGLTPVTVSHPRSMCSALAQVDEGAQLLPGSIINAGARVGSNAIVNSGAIVEHDCVIGDHAHIATGARLAGDVHVSRGAHIGIGATVRQGVHIGEYSVVGAGAVVIHDVAYGITVVGVPAIRLDKS